MAAGACPTESMEVVKTESDNTNGVPIVPKRKYSNQLGLQNWYGEQDTQ